MQLLQVLLGAALWSAADGHGQGHEQAYELKLAGACDNNLHLDGRSFKLQGTTMNGAPYWKADGDHAVYIYYDEDCDSSSDGTPRWIIDDSAPSLTAAHDLDGDQKCEYYARINSADKTHPPEEAEWHMECGLGDAKEWKDHYLILLARTSTTTTLASTSTTPTLASTSTKLETTVSATPAPTAAPNDTTTAASASSSSTGPVALQEVEWTTSTQEPSATKDPVATSTAAELTGTTAEAPEMIYLTGACEHKGYLNGLTFEKMTTSADGAPVYKAHEEEQYIYYDANCDGSGEDSPMWVLDKDRPSFFAASDLDRDGQCDYHARLSASSSARPPWKAEWTMYCGAGWQSVTMRLKEVPFIVVTIPPVFRKTTPAPQFVSGSGGQTSKTCALFVAVVAAVLAQLVAK